MTGISNMLNPAFKQKLFQSSLWHKVFKTGAETDHWISTMEKIVKWYEGKESFYFPCPAESKKETRFHPQKNALLTFIQAEIESGTFLADLKLRNDSFTGLKVLDLGSGPIPNILALEGCERWCLDHLMGAYKWIGYPLEEFESKIHYLSSKSEQIPVADGFFDVIVSRDALDHVDNFKQTAGEMKRTLVSHGFIHLLANYHSPTSSEPQALNDEKLMDAFGELGIRKVYERENAWGFDGGKSVLWSNVPDHLLALNSIPEERAADFSSSWL